MIVWCDWLLEILKLLICEFDNDNFFDVFLRVVIKLLLIGCIELDWWLIVENSLFLVEKDKVKSCCFGNKGYLFRIFFNFFLVRLILCKDRLLDNNNL